MYVSGLVIVSGLALKGHSDGSASAPGDCHQQLVDDQDCQYSGMHALAKFVYKVLTLLRGMVQYAHQCLAPQCIMHAAVVE